VRVLVTGIGGFVGPWLARALAARGHEVHGFVRSAEERSAVAGLTTATHQGDVTDRDGVARTLAAVAPEAVIHLAAVSFVPEAEADPDLAYRVNVGGTIAVLAAVRAAVPRARVLHVGSSDAYGAVRREELPVTEETPFRPLSVYGASKAAADITAAQWARSYGLDVVRARPFNHTGPGQQPTFVCAALARQIAAIERGDQEPVLRVGNADPVRDFSDVRDIVAGYVALLERGKGGEAYNLCAGEGVSIAEVIALLRTHARVPLRVASDPALKRAVEIERIVGSHARATADTGWAPTIPLTETLRIVLDDWRQRRA
jgi:GDP-4-dehydro-6-deoxy-D-mannose reductase